MLPHDILRNTTWMSHVLGQALDHTGESARIGFDNTMFCKPLVMQPGVMEEDMVAIQIGRLFGFSAEMGHAEVCTIYLKPVHMESLCITIPLKLQDFSELSSFDFLHQSTEPRVPFHSTPLPRLF